MCLESIKGKTLPLANLFTLGDDVSISLRSLLQTFNLKVAFSAIFYLMSFWWENGLFMPKMTEKRAILTLFRDKTSKIGSIDVPSNAINPMV